MLSKVFSVVSIPFKRESVFKAGIANTAYAMVKFQFPSNGKVYSKPTSSRKRLSSTRPFQFPSNGKVYSKKTAYTMHSDLEERFQFPSNGKVYSKVAAKKTVPATAAAGFNSLQTGKCIQSLLQAMAAIPKKVSIPFKRESVFKAWYGEYAGRKVPVVSIPFKRESVFKAMH